MSLGQALATAMSGLRATQANLSLVSSNVANAETAGYVRKSINQVTTTTGGVGSGVATAGVNRELDLYIQRQLRIEMSGAAYANERSSALQQLQTLYGTPGSTSTLETSYNSLLSSLQSLSTSTDSQSARLAVVNAAKALTQQLNSMSRGIQSLRSAAEGGLASSVNSANNAMKQIADINVKLRGMNSNDPAAAALMDQRDAAIDQLSQLMDVRVIEDGSGQTNVFTNSGVQLVGAQAATLSFNAQGTVTPNTLWSADPSQSNLGSLTINFPQGGSLDLISTGAIRSGKIAAYVELRDKTLVEAQTQLDQFAAKMASALSDKTAAGTAVTSGAQTGFDLDLSEMKNGNAVHLTYTDSVTGKQHQVSIVRVDDPSALPLQNTATDDPNDEVIGIDFSGGMSSVVSQLNSALGTSNLQFSASGSTLRILDDGAGGLSDVNAASVTTTVSSLNSGAPELPLFTDGGSLYTGAISSTGSQVTGLAARISVNSQLVGDPSKLVLYSSSTLTGDTTRPDFLTQRLTAGAYQFSPSTGLGTTDTPFNSTLLGYLQQFTSVQGEAASAASSLADGQSTVLNTLQSKFSTSAGVNVDDEMAHLLALQNAYAANARVLSVVKSMFDTLMQA